MKSNRFTAIAMFVAALAVVAIPAGPALAQCTITGPDSWCGSPVTLCGPDGSEFYAWTFPDGSYQYAQCITVNAPGSYELRFIDPVTGDWSPSCYRDLTSGGPAPLIAGDTSGCEGTALELCGPSGNMEYDWSGPSGFSAASACVSAGMAGDYSLRVRPLPDGCWSATATHAVAFANCTPPPPPPPPPSDAMSCPRPAWWWSKQCPDHDHGNHRISEAAMARIAACVDARGGTLEGGLCRTLLAHPRTLEMRARREIATVMANVCAGQQGLTSLDGRPVSLDPNAAVNVGGFHGTVSSWITAAQGAMAQAANGKGHKDREKDARNACREVIRVAWHINRGIGIGPVCSRSGDDLVAGEVNASSGTADDFSLEADPEPLAMELVDDTDLALGFGPILPNPFASQMTMGYSISTAGAADVSIGVYDLSGRLVRELVHGTQTPGQYVARWDGRDAGGAPVRGGMYFVLGRIDGARVQSRVTLVR